MVEVTLPGGYSLGDEWARNVWVRAWGGREELEVFHTPAGFPATRATALLSRCVLLDRSGTRPSPDFVRSLSIGDREALLLHLRAVTLGVEMPCVLPCPSCEEMMELELRVPDLTLPPYDHEGPWHTLEVEDGGQTTEIVFRLPTGGDQEATARLAGESAREAARAIAERCIRSVGDADDTDRSGTSLPALPARALARLSARMAELDPQAEIRVDVTCPDCARPCHTVLDTFGYLEAEVRRSRTRLHEEIHLLAYHYHWSEAEILGMTGAKRRTYIAHLLGALDARRAS